MSMPELMGEYLVRIGADIDNNSFNAAEGAVNQLVSVIKQLKGMAAMAAVASGIKTISQAAMDSIKSVAAADMEFTRLANQMWITKDSAKALSVAMKVMGVSEQDIAWIPELREQFFRLRGEMDALATPADADRQLKWIREIGYDVQSLQVKLKMLKEWVAYFLIKYLRPFIAEFQRFIQWLNEKLGKNMPEIAKKIAQVLAHIVSLGMTAIKVIKTIVMTVYRFVESLPGNVKRWGSIFAMVGAFILAGPFGKFIIALGGALILLEDFMYYLNGWNSSKSLAPVWGKLIHFLEGDTLSTAGGLIRRILAVAADLLDKVLGKLTEIVKEFFEGMDWEGIKKDWLDAIHELKEGVGDLYDALCDVFDEIRKNTDARQKMKQKSFWTFLGSCTSDVIRIIGRFAGRLGKIFKAVSMAVHGNFSGAARELGEVIMGTFQESSLSGLFGSLGLSDLQGASGDGRGVSYNVAGDADYDDMADNTKQAANLLLNLMKKKHPEMEITMTSGKRYGDGSSHHDDGHAFDITSPSFEGENGWKYREDYNELAKELGLTPLDEYPGGEGEAYAHGSNYHVTVPDDWSINDVDVDSMGGTASGNIDLTPLPSGKESNWDVASGSKDTSWYGAYANKLVSMKPAGFPESFAPGISGGGISFGNIIVNVAGNKAGSDNISRVLGNILNSRYGKGGIV